MAIARIQLKIAEPGDEVDISSLRRAVAETLTAPFGVGPWSRGSTEKGVLFDMHNAKVFVARRRNKIIATLTLTAKKPWAIDRKYFAACKRPLYLTSMAVAPELQRQGIGRLCVEAAKKIVQQWPADAIFLDAYDADAGAGEFYRECGFREVGRATYRDASLIYFELFV